MSGTRSKVACHSKSSDDLLANEETELARELVAEKTKEMRWLHTRKVVITVVVVALILFVVLDFSLSLCSMDEPEQHRLERLDCENRTLSITNPVKLEEIMNDEHYSNGFRCTLGMESPWKKIGTDKCVKHCACIHFALTGFLAWLQHNPYWGLASTALLYTVLTLLFIPGSLLAIGAGAAFAVAKGLVLGTILGTISVWGGAMTGALLAFGAGRWLFHSTVQQYTAKMIWLRAVDRAMDMHGVKLMILLRLSPIIPFNLFNYVMGCTSCSTRKFVVGSAIGIVPGALGYVFIGGAVSAAVVTSEKMAENAVYFCANPEMEHDGGGATARLVLSIVGGIATIVGVVCLATVSKREINKILALEKEQQENQSNPGNSRESVESVATTDGQVVAEVGGRDNRDNDFALLCS